MVVARRKNAAGLADRDDFPRRGDFPARYRRVVFPQDGTHVRGCDLKINSAKINGDGYKYWGVISLLYGNKTRAI